MIPRVLPCGVQIPFVRDHDGSVGSTATRRQRLRIALVVRDWPGETVATLIRLLAPGRAVVGTDDGSFAELSALRLGEAGEQLLAGPAEASASLDLDAAPEGGGGR